VYAHRSFHNIVALAAGAEWHRDYKAAPPKEELTGKTTVKQGSKPGSLVRKMSKHWEDESGGDPSRFEDPPEAKPSSQKSRKKKSPSSDNTAKSPSPMPSAASAAPMKQLSKKEAKDVAQAKKKAHTAAKRREKRQPSCVLL